jgi:hypothetical protein
MYKATHYSYKTILKSTNVPNIKLTTQYYNKKFGDKMTTYNSDFESIELHDMEEQDISELAYTEADSNAQSYMDLHSDESWESLCVQVTTFEHRMTLIFAEQVFGKIRIGSYIKLDRNQGTFRVESVMKRSADFDTLVCRELPNSNFQRRTTIGLIVPTKHFQSSWRVKLYRYVILYPYYFIYSKAKDILKFINNCRQ